MKAVLLNDTTKIPADAAHFGCCVVMETIRMQFDRVGIELIETRGIDLELRDLPREADLIVVNGEGSVHDGYRQELIEIASRFPCAFINGVYQNNPYTPAVNRFLYVSVRESLSAAAFREHGVEAEVVPDVVFASDRLHSARPGTKFDGVGVTDNVAGTGDWSGEVVSVHQSPSAVIEALGQYRQLCVGRFHAAVVAAVLGIPFSAWPSNTHKIEGLMADMGVARHYYPTFGEARSHVPDEFEETVTRYVSTARSRVEAMFERLAELVY